MNTLVRKFAALSSPLLLLGCASNPIVDANLGSPQALIAMVMSGEVKSNTRYTGYTKQVLPLCTLIGYKSAQAAIEKLLAGGSDVNMPCSLPQDIVNGYPLDMLKWKLAESVAAADPWWGGRARPAEPNLPYFQALADRLIDMGAKLGGEKVVSKGEFRQVVAQETREINALMTDKQVSYDKQIASNKSFVKGVTTVAQVAVLAYVASETGKVTSANLPLASKPAPSQDNATNSRPSAVILAENTAASTASRQASQGGTPSQTDQRPLNASSAPYTRETFPFERVGSFGSTGLSNYTKESALQSLYDERKKMEKIIMGSHIAEWKIVKEDEPVCTQRGRSFGDNGSVKDYWHCDWYITYAGRTYLNPNSPPPTGGAAQR